MSTEYVNQVTLECLMNKDTYKKYVATKKKSVVNKKDQKFYRRRILSLQEDYSTLTQETAEMSIEDIKTQAEIDQQFMRSIHVKEATTLDKFVKRSTTAPKEDPILPKQKDINLRDPALKNKGIRKKKNITNKYEEESKTKNTEDEANK